MQIRGFWNKIFGLTPIVYAVVISFPVPLWADEAQQPKQGEVATKAARDAASPAIAAADEAAGAASTVATAKSERGTVRSKDPMRLSDRQLSDLVRKLEPIKEFSSKTPEFKAWASELQTGLKTVPLASLTAGMAGRYGIAAGAMRSLARDWLVARVGDYELSDDGDLASIRKVFEEQVVRHVAEAGNAPFALEIAGQTLSVGGDCDGPAYPAILASTPDKALASWALARGSGCPKMMHGALATSVWRTSAMIMLLASWELRGTDAIAPQAWLLRPGALASVSDEDRKALSHWLLRDLISNLLDGGLPSEAIARFDALDGDARAAILFPQSPAFVVHIDGAGFAIPERTNKIRTTLAAAMVLAGRRADASALLKGDEHLVSKRALVNCVFSRLEHLSEKSEGEQTCGLSQRRLDDEIWEAVQSQFVHEAIDQTGADLYLLVEVGFNSLNSPSESGVMVRLRCHLLNEPQYAELCQNGRAQIASSLLPPEEPKGNYNDRKANIDAIAAAGISGWTEFASGYDRQRALALAEFTDPKVGAGQKAWADRDAVEPDASRFAEKTLPSAMRSVVRNDDGGPDWPRGWAKLPDGFEPVRTGASGTRAVAISLSGRFDRSGEVAAGGYWVHLSENGGKTWGAPLYTGLADHFPYVAPSKSKLPLLDGDTINLEVAIALLDTRTISYPPVALQTRKRAGNLYLEMPLSALQADADGDGLTDLAAHHLLLDRNATLAPFVVGSDRSTCPVQTTSLQALRAKMLLRLVGGRQQDALLEPVDRARDAELVFGWAKMPAAQTWPIFLKGDPGDFACLQLPVPTLVYGEAGEAALQRKTPDFRLLEAPPMIMNRAGTRGFMRWSLGWTGGTTMAFWKDGKWQTVELYSWIT